MLPTDSSVLPASAPVPCPVTATGAAPVTPPVVTIGPELPRQRRPPWLAIGFALVALTAGGLGFGLGRATGPDLLRSAETRPAAVFTITGSMKVNGVCGAGGYTDVKLGGQVEIVNQDNKVLGVGTLLGGTGSCAFRFTVSGVPEGERLYGAKIGNASRGVIWKSQQEAKSEGIHLTLG